SPGLVIPTDILVLLPVVAVAVVTNPVHCVLAFIKNFGESIYRNVRRTFNYFLSTNGVMGGRLPYHDPRHIGVRVFFGVITLPLVVPSSLIINAIDFVGTFFKHCGLSIARNVLWTRSAILGRHGVYDQGRFAKYADNDRNLGLRIFYGIITLPIAL